MEIVQDKVKVFALGGLDEIGKNLYVVEVNEKIFVLDTGLKQPDEDMLGVDAVIPDFAYLVENKSRIAGIFLTQGHDEHMGAIAQLLSVVNVPVYGTRLTMALVEDAILDSELDIKKCKLYKIRDENEMFFSGVKVSIFRTTHSIPGTVGVAIHTTSGVIVYTSDFVFNHNAMGHYQTNYGKIAEIAKEGVLCLLSESVNAASPGHTVTGDTLSYKLGEIFSRTDGRIICSLYSSDLHRIQMVVDMTVKHNRKLAILGRKMQRLVDIAVKMGYLKIPKSVLMSLQFRNEKNPNNMSDLVVITTGNRYEPFNALGRMVKGHDRFVRIEKSDTIVVATPPILGVETKAASTLDMLYRTKANVVAIDKSLLPTSHASIEDLKMMMSLFKPSYIMPVNGEYRHLIAHAKVAQTKGYDLENVIILNNGEIALFDQGQFSISAESIEASEVLVDGLGVGDVGTVVIRDRQMLSNDGVVVVVVNLDRKTKKVLSGPEIISRGYVYDHSDKALFAEVKNIVLGILNEKIVGKSLSCSWQDLRYEMREKIGKYLYGKTRHRPIVIPIIEELQIQK